MERSGILSLSANCLRSLESGVAVILNVSSNMANWPGVTRVRFLVSSALLFVVKSGGEAELYIAIIIIIKMYRKGKEVVCCL